VEVILRSSKVNVTFFSKKCNYESFGDGGEIGLSVRRRCAFGYRFAVKALYPRVRLLSGAIHRHHIHDSHPSTYTLLRIQPDPALCSHLINDHANIHATAGRRRKNIARYNVVHHQLYSSFYENVTNVILRSGLPVAECLMRSSEKTTRRISHNLWVTAILCCERRMCINCIVSIILWPGLAA